MGRGYAVTIQERNSMESAGEAKTAHHSGRGLAGKTAIELATLVHHREVSPVEVV